MIKALDLFLTCWNTPYHWFQYLFLKLKTSRKILIIEIEHDFDYWDRTWFWFDYWNKTCIKTFLLMSKEFTERTLFYFLKMAISNTITFVTDIDWLYTLVKGFVCILVVPFLSFSSQKIVKFCMITVALHIALTRLCNVCIGFILMNYVLLFWYVHTFNSTSHLLHLWNAHTTAHDIYKYFR